jgi:integrase
VLLVKAPAQVVSDRDAIPLEDVKALLKVLHARLGDVRWVAALLHGMRQGEALGLTWDAVDFEHSRIDVSWQLQTLPYLDVKDQARGFRVPEGFEARHLILSYHLTRPKTHAGTRIVPLMPWMADALIQWRKVAPVNPWGLVWGAVDRPTSPRIDRQMWVALQTSAGVSRPDGTPYTLHEARHTAASLMLAAGVDAKVVSEIMGHSTVAMSRAYQHAGDQLKLDAFEAVSRRLGIEN